MKTLVATVAIGFAAMTFGAHAEDKGLVGIAMPTKSSLRWISDGNELVKALEAKGYKADLQYAEDDIPNQLAQIENMVTKGPKALIIASIDGTTLSAVLQQAHDKGTKVIAYDRPIPDKQADYYVSFDNEGIGKAIAESLVAHLKATGVAEGSGVLEINGSPTDAAAGLIRDGVHKGLENSGYKTLAEFDTPEWAPPKAQEWTAGQITRFGAKIKGVVAANDGTAGGAIAAFKAAGVNPVPPVTGNDATIAALQLIISGDQYNTISKPSEIVAAAAAKVAVAFLKGETPAPKTTLYKTPSELFVPAVVTQENIKAEIFDKGIQKPEEICTGEYAEGCKKLGITK